MMIDRWPPGPPATADGFTLAWQRGRRRRARTAILTASPLVVLAMAAAALMTPTGSSRDGLTVTNGGLPGSHAHGQSSAGNQVQDGAGSGAAGIKALTPSGTGAAPSQVVSGAGSNDVSVGAPTASGSPTPRSAPPQTGSLELSGSASSSVTFVLHTPCLLRLDQLTTQGGNNYVGVYIRRSDTGADIGQVFFPKINQTGAAPMYVRFGSAGGELKPGRYVAYLLADTTATVRVPLQPEASDDAPNLALHPRTATSVTVNARQTTLGLGQNSGDLRAAAPFDAGTTGAVAAYFGGQNLSDIDIRACMPRKGKACASGDPQDHGSTAVAVGGYIGATVNVPLGSVTVSRDETGSASAPTGTGGTLYLITVALRVR